MQGDVEIRHERDGWRVAVEGQASVSEGHRTLEEALDVAWAAAARLRVALHVGGRPVTA